MVLLWQVLLGSWLFIASCWHIVTHTHTPFWSIVPVTEFTGRHAVSIGKEIYNLYYHCKFVIPGVSKHIQITNFILLCPNQWSRLESLIHIAVSLLGILTQPFSFELYVALRNLYIHTIFRDGTSSKVNRNILTPPWSFTYVFCVLLMPLTHVISLSLEPRYSSSWCLSQHCATVIFYYFP